MNFRTLLILLAGCLVPDDMPGADPFPIDPLWKSESFRKAFAGVYGIDSRIEPLVNEDEQFYLSAAAELMAGGDRPAAIRKLMESGLAEESPAIQFSLGNFHFEEGESEKAITWYRKALELFPNFRDALRNLAVLEIQADEVDGAEEHLRRAIALGAKDGLAYGLLGYCHSLKGRTQAALTAYRMAQMTMPESAQWKLGEARMLERLEEPARAGSIYEALLRESPENSELWVLRANTFLQRENLEDAIAHLEFAGRMKPLTPGNAAVLGQMYLRKGLPALALSNFRSAVDGGGIPLAEAAALVGQLTGLRYHGEARDLGNRCREVYRKELAARESRGERSLLHRSLALVELEDGDAEKGALLVEEIVEADPLDGEALLLLAKFRENSGEPEEAIHLLEQAAGIPAVRARALLEHGKILAGQYRYEEAVKRIDESLKLEPSERVREYLAAVRELIRE